MKKSILVTLLACSLVFLSGVRGVAGTLWDIDLFFPPKYLSGQNTKYTDYFDITSKYNPNLEKVTFAKLWVAATDDQVWPWPDSQESAAVYLGDQLFLGPKNISLNLLSGEITGNALATLDNYGKLKYSIRREEGDFLVWSAKLLVETSPRSVPDGGATLMLLGVGLAGIESLRRRTARRNLQKRRA
jgi:hypothetical protein